MEEERQTTPQQKQVHRISKLSSITGRKNSVEQLQVFLSPTVTSLEEAQKNREHIEKSDRMKKVFGSRPPVSTSSSSASASASATSPTGSSTSRVAKLRSVTGRRMSVDALQDLLMADSPEEAVAHGKLIEKSDKLRQVLGQRPPTHSIISASPSTTTHRTTRRMSHGAKPTHGEH